MFLVKKLNETRCNRIAIKALELEVNKEFRVNKIKEVKTKFGPSMLFDIGEVDIWVPKRYQREFSKEDILSVNNGVMDLKFKIKEIVQVLGHDTPVFEFL